MNLQIDAPIVPLTLPAGYSARPAALADVSEVVALMNLSSRALLGVDQVTVDEWATEWQTPGFELSANTRVVLAPGGELAGYVNLWDAPPHVQFEQFGRVHPSHSGRGLGSYLLAWVEKRAGEILPKAPPAARVTLVDWINSLDLETHRLFRDYGHQHVRSNFRMVIELDPNAPPTPPAWPAGVGVRSFVPGQDDRATLEVIRAAFRDHWGSVEEPFEQQLQRWAYRWRNDPEFDSSLWFLAMAGDEVIGTALSRMGLPEAPDMGWVFSLGVLRPWRRQGIAGALLQHCFAELYQRGRRRAALGVDADSLTNALHLYEKAGMRSDPTHIYQVWEKELRPGLEWSTTELEDKTSN
jgi:mycothiol synthase